MSSVVALVPAKDAADTIASTVEALLALESIDEVLVVDDGSDDSTNKRALAVGASVLTLPTNVGKGGAVAEGVRTAPEADIYVLVDADTGSTASEVGALIEPVLMGDADMTIAVLPPAGTRAGFGTIKRLAQNGIMRASGVKTTAPLSGQRAIRGSLLRELSLTSRFGLEVGLTIDVARRGGRVLEVAVPMDHRHTGRSLSGFRHRGRQGADVIRALWPRVTSTGQRMALIFALFAVAASAVFFGGARNEIRSDPIAEQADRVVIFGVPGLALEDLRRNDLPNLRRLQRSGGLAATTVRTYAPRATTVEGYASIGAGARVRAFPQDGLVSEASAPGENGTVRSAVQRRTARTVRGELVVTGAAHLRKLLAGKNLPSGPGALGEALLDNRRSTAVVGTSHNTDPATGQVVQTSPGGLTVMDGGGSISSGAIGEELVRPDARFAYGVRADDDAIVDSYRRAVQTADLIMVDSGDMDRARNASRESLSAAAERQRDLALRSTDALLGRLLDSTDTSSTLFILTSVAPVPPDPHVTPTMMVGPGVPPNSSLHSASTQRAGLITLTDLAPTILESLGLSPVDGMIGHPLRVRNSAPSVEALVSLDGTAGLREEMYKGLTFGYIILQALVYLVATIAFRRSRRSSLSSVLRLIVLAIAAYPMASFVLVLLPGADKYSAGTGVLALLALNAVIVFAALRFRSHALQPFSWICGTTLLLIAVDLATGARMQMSSLFGYSPYNAGRFDGLGNPAFAVLAATALLVAAIHVHTAPRRREALVTAGGVLALAVFIDGAPALGSDVGGILSLVPVFGIALLALAGRKVSGRSLVVAVGLTAILIAVATGVDLLRPEEQRSHLGRLATSVSEDGLSVLTTTVARKMQANFRSFGSPWTWALPVLAAYLIYVLAWAGGWTRLLPQRSALRVGAVATLAAGLFGYLANDSGVVVVAIIVVFLGPYLTLLALEADMGVPVLQRAGIPPMPTSGEDTYDVTLSSVTEPVAVGRQRDPRVRQRGET